MFCYKVHEIGEEKILAVADKEIVGKVLKEKAKEIFISPEFYSESEADGKKLAELSENATHINAFGNAVVELLVKNKIVDKSSVIKIAGVSHAQVYTVEEK